MEIIGICILYLLLRAVTLQDLLICLTLYIFGIRDLLEIFSITLLVLTMAILALYVFRRLVISSFEVRPTFPSVTVITYMSYLMEGTS
ncbi:hypothetical protein BHU11_10000 [Tannerella sp. oral taxon 808]|nr:hypothetical protein BHU11_10000 [Tannerella sp. oral taxon 808]